MARIRSIKPEFWTSDQVVECSTSARLLFIGLWNFCDDEGRHPMSAKKAKAEVYPSDPISENDVHAMLMELVKAKLIIVYSSEDKEYFYIPGWHHQRIDRPQPAKYPSPFADPSTSIRGTFVPDRIGKDKIGKDSSRSKTEPKKKEATGKKSRRSPQLPIPDDWKPTDAERQYARDQKFSEREIDRQITRFIGHAREKDRRCAKWGQAWRNWIVVAVEFRERDGKKPGNGAAHPEQNPKDWPKETWIPLIKNWHETGHWSRHAGPDPTQPGCVAPRDLLSPK